MNFEEGTMSTNEERIVQFIEKELSPAEERALLDECASSDEMRSLLKQHVTLSKRLASTLSSVAVPVAATDKLNETLAEMRKSSPAVPGAGSKALLLTAVAGALLLLVSGVTFFASQNTTEQTQQSIAQTSIVAELPPVPTITQQDNVSSVTAAVDYSLMKPAAMHHRVPFKTLEKQIAKPKSVAQNVQNDSVVAVKPHQRHSIILTPKDQVNK